MPSNGGLVKTPPLHASYAANVILVVAALFPGLINTSAIPVLASYIARDLHGSATVAYAVPLLSDAALAFGCLLAAEMSRRADGRLLFHLCIGVSSVCSLASATATSFPVFVIAHLIHGLVAGMLFVTAVPPLLVGFDHRKLPLSAMVLVPSLFGAATLGPFVGSLVAGPHAWRIIFGVEVLTALATNLFGFLVLTPRPPSRPCPGVDWYALLSSALATMLMFVGVIALSQHDWFAPQVFIPVGLAVLTYAAMVAVEAVTPDPLVPVRALAGSLALAGVSAAVIGSACFGATQESLIITLTRIDGYSLRETGLAMLPGFAAALLAGFLFARLLTTRWVVLVALLGLGLSGIAASLVNSLTPVSLTDALVVAFIAALGAGLTVTPGLFLISLSFPRALVARAVALLNLLRLTVGFISGPGIEHQIGSRALVHYTGFSNITPGQAETMVRAYVLGQPYVNGLSMPELREALVAGVSQALGTVTIFAIVGIVAMEFIFRFAGVRLIVPDLAAFDKGLPALESPPLPYERAGSVNERKSAP